MPTDPYDDLIDSVAPARKGKSHPNKIAFQPDDADWSLDRLGELDSFYQANYKRPLPLTNKGQGSVHNKMGYDHRNSSDISVNPNSVEGQRLMTEMRSRNMPFLAFTGPIPGVSTGPHIHAGRPSHRTANKYQVGAQVRKLGQVKAKPTATPDSYDTLIDQVTGDDYDQLIDKVASQSVAPLPKKLDISKVEGGVTGVTPPRSNIANVDEILTAARTPSRGPTGPGPRSPWEGVTAGVNAPDTGIGALRQRDEPEVSRITRISAQVAEENKRSRIQRASGSEAQGLAQRYRDQPGTVNSEVLRRVSAEKEAESRRRELIASLTDEDRRTIQQHAQNMLAMDPVSRGIEKGAQHIGSGLLYKLAGASDLLLGTETEFGKDRPTAPLSAYLRRQAGRGELDLEQIEAEMPPDTREQWAIFITQMAGALPELYGATALGGPIGGFAALHGLEAMGREGTTGEVALETVKGAALGKMFNVAGRLPNIATQGLAIGGGTVAIEKAFGAEDADALRAAATNIAFHTAMKAPEIVSRITAAAERVYVKPDGPTRPTVGDDLQSRLSDDLPGEFDILSRNSQFDAIRAKEAAPETPIPPTPIPRTGTPTRETLDEAIAKSQVPIAAEQAGGTPRPVVDPIKPTGDKDLDYARQAALDYGIEIVRVPGGYTLQRHSGEYIADVATSSEAATKVREVITKLDQGVGAPEAPRRLMETPPELIGVKAEANGQFSAIIDTPTGKVRKFFDTQEAAEAAVSGPPRRSVAELMAERAESGPSAKETPTVTPSVTELSRTARELAEEFHDWKDASPKEVESRWGMPLEDPVATLENKLMGVIDSFAKETGLTFDQANQRLMDMKPGEYSPLHVKRKGEAGFIDPVEISEGLGAGIEKVREKLGDEQLTGREGVTIGAPLAHTRPDISGKPIVATTADGRAIVPNEANKGGVSLSFALARPKPLTANSSLAPGLNTSKTLVLSKRIKRVVRAFTSLTTT